MNRVAASLRLRRANDPFRQDITDADGSGSPIHAENAALALMVRADQIVVAGIVLRPAALARVGVPAVVNRCFECVLVRRSRGNKRYAPDACEQHDCCQSNHRAATNPTLRLEKPRPGM